MNDAIQMHAVIYKYPVPIEGEFSIEMSACARVLTVQMQHGTPTLWAIVDPDATTVGHGFRIVGTGHRISRDELTSMSYVGTFQDGGYVWHLFKDNAE